MIVSEEQINELKPYIKNIYEVISEGDVRKLLEAIDDLIVENILNKNDEPDDEGVRLQRIYDQIYIQNK